MKLLALGILVFWASSRGGFSFFFVFLMFLFICMMLKGGRHGWHHNGYGPHHNQGQQRPPTPEEVRPYRGQPGAPGNPYYGEQPSHGNHSNEGTPTVRTDMNSGTRTVRVDNAPGTTGEPTTPLNDQPRPEQPRARVEHDQQ